MRIALFIAFLCFVIIGCTTNYETKELYGDWQGPDMGILLNEDGSGELRLKGGSRKVGWRDAMGNTLEITAGGKVIMSNLTIKHISQDTLIVETRKMIGNRSHGEKIHTMLRVK